MFTWCSQMFGFRTRVLSSTSSICHYGLWHVATEWCRCLQRVLQDWNKAGTHQPSSAAKNPQRATRLFVSLFAWYLWVKICRVWKELVALWRPTILGLTRVEKPGRSPQAITAWSTQRRWCIKPQKLAASGGEYATIADQMRTPQFSL